MNAFLRAVMQRRDAEHEATLLERGRREHEFTAAKPEPEWWAKARELHAQGQTLSAIGRNFNVSAERVSQVVNGERRKMTGRPPAAWHKQVLRLHAEGLSNAEIAKACGKPAARVSDVLYRKLKR